MTDTRAEIKKKLTLLAHKPTEQHQLFKEHPFLFAKWYKYSNNKTEVIESGHLTVDSLLHIMRVFDSNEYKKFQIYKEFSNILSAPSKVPEYLDANEKLGILCMHFVLLGVNSDQTRLKHLERVKHHAKSFENLEFNSIGMNNVSTPKSKWNEFYTLLTELKWDSPRLESLDDYLQLYVYDRRIDTKEFIHQRIITTTSQKYLTFKNIVHYIFQCTRQARTPKEFIDHVVEAIVYWLMFIHKVPDDNEVEWSTLSRHKLVDEVFVLAHQTPQEFMNLCMHFDKIFQDESERAIEGEIREMFGKFEALL